MERHEEMLSPEEQYAQLAPTLDADGFSLYAAAEEITGLKVYEEFPYEDNRGMFEMADGHTLLRYLEAAYFGAVTWEIVPGTPYERAILGEVDKTTPEYGQTTLSNHRAERSGVLLIKEATKKGYKEANPGDSVDLGFSGSNTRRGRVGQDIAHTLETSCIQGIVERGGRIRRLMPWECLRLQGFDEWQIDRILAIQSDAQAYKQAGNSVTANVIEAIGRRIREVDAELKAGAAA